MEKVSGRVIRKGLSVINSLIAFQCPLFDHLVYDVSKFMDEHPGGDEVLLSEAGRDGSDAFEDVGHSDDARALLPGMLKGELEGAEQTKSTSNSAPKVNQAVQESGK